jgi:hypothetical protein
MGGFGSGNFNRRPERKSTVEEAIWIAMRDFRGEIFDGAVGSFVRGRGREAIPRGRYITIAYSVAWEDGLTITLQYPGPRGEEVELPILVHSTPTQFGGERWWFSCPATPGGVPCDRRVDKLFLPRGEEYFACRNCHGLTYRSCQEAHYSEREFDRMDNLGKWAAKLMRRKK